ncbi:MAG: hypothetical protein C0625_12915 [Arcobacter sp.]|nr:MAG: hypothetical protein C0625_12915 [Arcobacter sp.]
MKLEYTGPKEIISPHGIDFKSGKDDKYVYIYPAIQVYDAIHHDYKKDTIYTHNIEGKRANNDETLSKILNIEPTIKESSENEIINFEKYLDNEIEDVKKHELFTEIEKDVYKNNLIIMKKYRIKRETNKIIYNHLIEIIVEDIIIHRLKEVNTPFNERYWHILQTIQGELSHHKKRSIGSTLDTIHSDSIRLLLKINSIGK